MKKLLTILFICAAFATKAPANTQTEDHFSRLEDAKKKLSEFLPKLQDLGQTYPDDVQIQLGLASLYSMPGYPPNFHLPPILEQIEKALKADPENKPAWAFKAKLICRRYTAKRKFLLDELESVINNTKERNLKKLKIPIRADYLYRWFEGDGKEPVVFEDFNTPVEILTEKLDREIPAVLSTLAAGQDKDPNNALYNYARACLFLELGQKDTAMEEVRKGVKKPSLNHYAAALSNAEARVLREIDFPEPQRNLILDEHGVVSGAWVSTIWEMGIEDLGKAYEKQGNLEQAEEIYSLGYIFAKQISEEPVPYEPQFKKKIAQSYSRKAQQHIEALHNNPPTGPD